MSKVKLTVANAVSKFKKGVDKRNTRNTESEIASLIADQIDLKEAEIVTLKKDITKNSNQSERDFYEGLAIFDEDEIKSVKAREEYAISYVSKGIAKMNKNKDFIKGKEEEIEELTKEIADLKEFRTVLTNLESKIEVEVED